MHNRFVESQERSRRPRDLRSRPVIVAQHAAEALSALDRTRSPIDRCAAVDQSVVQPLVISLPVKVSKELDSGLPQRRLPEEDHAIQALLLQAPHESLQMRVEVRRTRRKPDRFHAGISEYGAERRAELGVAIHEKVRLVLEEPVTGVGQIPCGLFHPALVWG